MRRVLMLTSVVFLGCLMGLAPVGLAQTAPQTSTPIAPTGALQTFANGINAGSSTGSTCVAPGWVGNPGQHNGQTQGQHVGLCHNPNADHTGGGSNMIVGYYILDLSTMAPTSYTLSGTNLNTSMTVPGAAYTYFWGVNGSGQIVGYYIDSAWGTHGFVLSGSSATTIDHPGAYATIANGINNTGQVVGNFRDGTGMHGFVYSGGSFTDFDSTLESGIRVTIATGINDSGQIVGYYYTSDFHTRKSFQRTPAGTISALNLNISGATDVVARGINTSGQVAGFFTGADSMVHGFVYSNSSTTQIDVTGSLDTQAYGINDSGIVVGQYVDSSNLIPYGFHMP